MLRRTTNERKDARYFVRTASKTKAVNLSDRVYRGGFRF